MNNQLFKNMIMNNWNAVVYANINNIVEYVNPKACELYGYKEDELLGQTTDIFNSNLSHNTDKIVESIKKQGYWSGEMIQKRKDGSTFDALLSVQLMFNNDGNPVGFASNSKDITNDLETAKNLKKTIEEKELLLKELHHRVKNNLSVIKGILSLQSNQYQDEKCTKLIEDFKNRIDAVATMHNSLYDPKNLSNLNLKAFINDLCASLNRSFSHQDKEIKITLNIGDYYTKVSKAVPLCLIINEVITNAFKHAFKLVNHGTINILLTNIENNVSIEIKDNGSGFNFDEVKNKSLGMSLISDLSEQIDAKYQFENNNGTFFNLRLN